MTDGNFDGSRLAPLNVSEMAEVLEMHLKQHFWKVV